MEDIFKPTSLTVKQLFGDTTSLYQIPRYQRPYSWSDDQLDKLWEDLTDAQNNEPNYFLGSVITAKASDNNIYLDIVDGQQRLTTLTILLCVARDMYPSINKELSEKDPNAVDEQIIKSSIKLNDRFERLRLKTHSNHESDFQNLVLKEGNSINYYRPLKKNLRKEEEPKYKFMNTACFFREKLEELGEINTGIFINYLFNNVKIIRIDCQSVSFAIKLFQVLNDRGLDLSNSDLIKSFLIGRIHKLYASDAEVKKQKEDQFMDDWKTCENVAIDTDESLNNLFVIYEYYRLGDNPTRSLYDELECLFENEDPNEVIADIKKFLGLYKEELYYKEDSTIYPFWYLRWSMYWRSILLAALHLNYPKYEELKKNLMRYYYLNWIAGNTLTKIKQTSFNLIKHIKDKKDISVINEELEKHLTDQNTISRAIESLNREIYFEPWCKPLLFCVEYGIQDKPIMHHMTDKNIQIEHILPQAYKKNKDWERFKDDTEIESWVNSGANLTLLSGSKNIAASYYGFEKKIKAYEGNGYHKASDGKITSFRMTQQIANDFNSKKFNGEWNWDALKERKKWFIDRVNRLLDIKVTEAVKE